MTKPPIRIQCGEFFDLQGLKLHYLDQGQGDPVVMVHGNPSWSLYYRNLVEALSPSYRCIVPDHIGCGFSDKPDDSRYTYTLSRRIDDLEALLAHLGVNQRITLVMHDWGGLIGMGFATRHPEMIERLVILNTAAFDLPPGKNGIPPLLRFCRDTRAGAWLIENANAFSVAASWLGCTAHPMNAALRAAYQLPYKSRKERIATLRFIQDIPLNPNDPAHATLLGVQERLSLFKDTPALIAWGLKDPVFDADYLAEWERRMPQAEVHRYPHAGHYILEDMQADLIPKIQAFLKRTRVPAEVA
ncbi:MAG: alpha/beta fold hydrolase [Candidatus Sericytochromatia bacterium]